MRVTVAGRPPRWQHPARILKRTHVRRRPSCDSSFRAWAGRSLPGSRLRRARFLRFPLLSRATLASPIGWPRVKFVFRRVTSLKGTCVTGVTPHGETRVLTFRGTPSATDPYGVCVAPESSTGQVCFAPAAGAYMPEREMTAAVVYGGVASVG